MQSLELNQQQSLLEMFWLGGQFTMEKRLPNSLNLKFRYHGYVLYGMFFKSA